MRVDFGAAPNPHPRKRPPKGTSYLPFQWATAYTHVIFDTSKFTDPMDVIYFEPVLGWEGVIVKEFNAHVTVEFNDELGSIYIVPKRLLKGIE